MDIYTWATGGFTRFTDCWDFKDFWTRGNTFDALLHFVGAAEQKWPDDPVIKQMLEFRKSMIQANSDYFNTNGGRGWWADDYGWWGIACLEAYNHLLSIKDEHLATTFREYAMTCWDNMYKQGYDTLDTARPVPHGCANSGGDPQDGTKNTVTNANLFVLSLRLYKVMKTIQPNDAQKYLKMAYAQYVWFNTWFAPNYDYLHVIPGPYGLVHERPIAEPDYEHKDRPTWEKGWVWTGDQGLLLAALAEIHQIQDDLHTVAGPNFDQEAFANDVREKFTIIVTGVKIILFGAEDNILREAPFNSSFVDDPKDYVCGRGVLLRYLFEPSVRKMLNQSFFPDGVRATAAAVWDSRDPSNNQFAAGWTPGKNQAFNEKFKELWGYGDPEVEWGDDFCNTDIMCNGIKQATGLDVLTAALVLD